MHWLIHHITFHCFTGCALLWWNKLNLFHIINLLSFSLCTHAHHTVTGMISICITQNRYITSNCSGWPHPVPSSLLSAAAISCACDVPPAPASTQYHDPIHDHQLLVECDCCIVIDCCHRLLRLLAMLRVSCLNCWFWNGATLFHLLPETTSIACSVHACTYSV